MQHFNHNGSWHEKTLYTQHYRGSCLGGMEEQRLGCRGPQCGREREGLFVTSAVVLLVSFSLPLLIVKVVWQEKTAPPSMHTRTQAGFTLRPVDYNYRFMISVNKYSSFGSVGTKSEALLTGVTEKTERNGDMKKNRPPLHPGAALKHECDICH